MRPVEKIYNPNDNRDLGFGSILAQESRQRLMNRDGSFNAARLGLSRFSLVNLYHFLLTMSWTRFLLLVAGVYFVQNVTFALLYLACGQEALVDVTETPVQNRFWQAFFFSVHTFATIGYGTIHPVGYAANFLVTLESYVSMLAQALVTGVVFARFARPTAQIVFSDTAIIAPYQDITAFMFRIVNARINQLIEVKAQVALARFVEENGKKVRRFDPLYLERRQVTFFSHSWTIVHPIDEGSPLYGCTAEDLQKSDAEFLILLTAIDETFSQTVHTRSSYKPDEILWNVKFADIYVRGNETEVVTIDVRKLSKVEKVANN
ncbi:MAG TPA: ion channel [Pyrinomonadaceae bacterium]|nr:ion channel [Pyrinomonadaceae bacterium]